MSDRVRAAVQVGPRSIELQEFDRPRIGADDGLLRVEACGICGSDVEQYRGHLRLGHLFPVIPGHEPLGVIEEIGERAAERWEVQVGDRVAVEIVIPCHTCKRCLQGDYLRCKRRLGGHGYVPTSRAPSLWGGFAEYLYLHPDAVVHKVRSDIPAPVAAMFNPLGAGVNWACRVGGVKLGDTVLVLGSGQRGIASVIAAKAAGAATVIVTGLARDQGKLRLAQAFGADVTINVEEEDTVARVREITDGEMADVVLELTPMATEPVRDAVEAVADGGRIVLAGLKGGREVSLVTDHLISKSVTVAGAMGVDAGSYLQAIRIIESGAFPLERLHTRSFGLEDAALAIETLGGEVDGVDALHVAISPTADLLSEDGKVRER